MTLTAPLFRNPRSGPTENWVAYSEIRYPLRAFESASDREQARKPALSRNGRSMQRLDSGTLGTRPDLLHVWSELE